MQVKRQKMKAKRKHLTTHKSSEEKGIKMKTQLLSIATLLCAFSAPQVHAESIGDAMEKCRKTDNSLKRLMCYDGVAKSLNQYDGVSAQVGQLKGYKPNNSAQANSRPAPVTQQAQPSEPKNDFGLEHKRDLTEAASEIAVTINAIKKNLRDKYVLTFSDGSVWQQTDQTYLKLKEGQVVSVERGLLGAFYLSVEGLNKRMKVKRVK